MIYLNNKQNVKKYFFRGGKMSTIQILCCTKKSGENLNLKLVRNKKQTKKIYIKNNNTLFFKIEN